MADLERLTEALKAADEAGDEEAARRLAQEIRDERTRQLSATTRLGAGTSAGIAKTAGAPVDLVNKMLQAFGAGSERPVGGSEQIQGAMAEAGMTVPPGQEENLGRAGRVGEVVGSSAVGVGGVAGAGARAARAAAAGGRGATSVSGRVAQETAEQAASRPGQFAAAEGAASTAAGLASFEASERFPNSPGMQAVAELAGGFAPAGVAATGRAAAPMVERLPLLGPKVVKGVRSMVSSLSLRGGKRRAEARARRATEDPEGAAERVDRTDVLPGLSPAQRAGDEGLLSLEASIMESTPELSIARQRQLADVNRTISDSMSATGQEVPTQQAKDYLQDLLDTRMSIAAQRADERIAELGPNVSREDVNRIAREELENARTAARNQEQQLHENIPADAEVPTVAGQDAFQDIVTSTSRAQSKDIPPIAKRMLNPESDDYLGDVTTMRELRGLQSSLREDARVSRSNGRLNRARISDQLANSLSEDIKNATGGPEVREAVDLATDYSKRLNDRFTRGPVGRLLGTDQAGGQSVPPGRTLEVSVGQRGSRSREASDALMRAVNFSGNEEAMRGHIQAFLMDDFRRAAVKNGRIDPKAAERYVNENQDVLSRFPELRDQFQNAGRAGGQLEEAERLANPRVSRAAVFINAPPGREVERVVNSSNPRQGMEELASMARLDETGRALDGLKGAFMDHLLRRSELHTSLDASDAPFVSGQRMTRELEDPQMLEPMKALFTPDELKRIERIRKTAAQLDKARQARPAGEGDIGDMPGMLTSMIARVSGAQAGRVLAQRTGGGTVQTPGIFASQVQKLLRAGIQDPARRLLNDAVQDDDLFKALLLPTNTPERTKAVRTRLNAWVSDVLAEQHEVDDESQ